MSCSSQRYLLIIGAPKSATTSLFQYLSDHPSICPASRKETYFFSRQYDFKQTCKDGNTLESFERYFSHGTSASNLRLEATPYTLYTDGAAHGISTVLPRVDVIAILRDPVERLFSDYHFQAQREHPSAKGSFEEYVDYQNTIEQIGVNHLEMGNYIDYLYPFFEAVGRKKTHIVFFEELRSNPSLEMQKLCQRLELDDRMYSSYDFGVRNQTVHVRSSRLNRLAMQLELIVRNSRERVIGYPKAYRTFERSVRLGKKLYHQFNSQAARQKAQMSDSTRAKLEEYYCSSSEKLAQEIGYYPSWRSVDRLRENVLNDHQS